MCLQSEEPHGRFCVQTKPFREEEEQLRLSQIDSRNAFAIRDKGFGGKFSKAKRVLAKGQCLLATVVCLLATVMVKSEDTGKRGRVSMVSPDHRSRLGTPL